MEEEFQEQQVGEEPEIYSDQTRLVFHVYKVLSCLISIPPHVYEVLNSFISIPNHYSPYSDVEEGLNT